MSTNIRGLVKRYRVDGDYEWHIDKRIKRCGRLCESTGTATEMKQSAICFIA